MRVAVLLFFAVTFVLPGHDYADPWWRPSPDACVPALLRARGLQGDEPWHSVIVVLSLGAPAFFLVMAVLAVILRRRGRPLD